METDDDSDVLAALTELLLSPTATVAESQRLAAALSGVRSCSRCDGTGGVVWYDAIAGRLESWPCSQCRASAFDEREAAELAERIRH